MRTRLVYESEVARVHEVWCDDGPEPVTAETEAPVAEVVLPRRGVYRRHVAGEELLAEPSVAFFYNVGDVSHISHPTTCGDSNTTFAPGPRLLEELGDADGRLPTRTVRLTGAQIARHVRLHRCLRDRMAADEAIVDLLAGLVTPAERSAPSPRQRRLASAAVELLAARRSPDVGLGELAAGLGASISGLSRAVTATFGLPLTRIRSRLRVRHALERISCDGADLAAIAVDAGFYDQAHMTNVIRREVGETPRALAG